ncbi:hypothetical protein C5167_042254 [Papaver somniferum]|uniref:Uncharacterized protein n=1 Tax=Papaver somniferum TaxID=3469 RepID=A0A4Y7L5H3_PAPSO|nr:uncharacterized protein LOC113318854 [Papaver somniferum]RZC79678.1 hypothetical protein C5167_042254 [Papaver somniferum]
MSVSIGSSSISRLATSSFSSSNHLRRSSKLTLSSRLFDRQRHDQQRVTSLKGGEPIKFTHGRHRAKGYLQKQFIVLASSEDLALNSELRTHASDEENLQLNAEDNIPGSSSVLDVEGSEGKPGFISFSGRPRLNKEVEIVVEPPPIKRRLNLLSFICPTILVASFIVPSLYLRRILSSIFEDSLLTDFLILFFTEALFYCGVAVFLLLIHHSHRPLGLKSSLKSNNRTQLVHRISSVTALALSLIIPMVTMGLVWPWTGPAASATLAPFLVGIVVQFAFEQYARYLRSPSWPVIPFIFQVYRLHQLNRAAQLVTALSFTVRGAEATSHNLAINSSLATLLNVLQFLGIICIWSLASFLMRFFPSSTAIPDS